MPAVPRRKACHACASSKRRCDKQFPECQRCLDNDLDCVYPQPLRRKRPREDNSGQTQVQSSLFNHPDFSFLNDSIDGGDWGGLEIVDNRDPWTYSTGLQEPILSAFLSDSVPWDAGSKNTALRKSCPWFLESETWRMLYCNPEPACLTDVYLEPFIDAVRQMLHSWVQNGHNSFIHHRLYAKGMPSCLQVAFTTLATYLGAASSVRELVLQIVEERLITLSSQHMPSEDGVRGMLTQLAHVQALFVYEFIGLYDGSIRLRACAEQRVSTLRQWINTMWNTVKHYRGEDGAATQRTLRWTATDFDTEYDASAEMWQLWILTESARRTYNVSHTITNIYETLAKGSADCSGAALFTARRGLWEAESATQWFELCCAKSPLLVSSLQPGPLIAQYTAEEIDDFAKLYWTFVVGNDRMKSWLDKKRSG